MKYLQDKSCNNCSLASVCSGSDKSSNISGDLLREERIKIFGECSSITRDDNISVVFKEIPKDNTKDKYYKIEPLFRDDNPSKLKSVEFDLPTGYVIPYNFPLNTRRGFRTIYFLMKLTQHDMTTVIKDIIAVRHAGINFITNICDKLEKENNCMLTSLRGG